MHSEADNDILMTECAQGSLFGGTGNDTLTGHAENDCLDRGSGIDRLTGGAGNDVVRLEGIEAGDFADGGSGNDALALIGGASNDNMSLASRDARVNGSTIGFGLRPST